MLVRWNLMLKVVDLVASTIKSIPFKSFVVFKDLEIMRSSITKTLNLIVINKEMFKSCGGLAQLICFSNIKFSYEFSEFSVDNLIAQLNI